MSRHKTSLKKILPETVRIALSAGRIIMKHYRTNIKVLRKADKSPLTKADLEASQLIVAELNSLCPDIPIITEEGKIPPYSKRKKWTQFWLIDPLDGTKEFIKKNGEFTVNIGLIRNQKPVLGVVYAPAKKLLYYGAVRNGAWLKKGAAKAKSLPIKTRKKSDPYSILVSRSHAGDEMKQYYRNIKRVKRISVGSSLKFCYLAQGEAHLYPRTAPTMEWDVAAGDCLYRIVRNKSMCRSPLKYNKKNLKNGGFLLGYC